MRRWCRTTTIAIFVVLWTVPGVAQDVQPLRFDYAAAPDCPVESEFLERLARRTEKLHLAEPGELARRFVVKVNVVPTGAVGQLEFLDLASEPIVRRIVADSCDEAVTGLALITALAIEGWLPGLSESPEQPARPMATTPPKAALKPSPIGPPTVERLHRRASEARLIALPVALLDELSVVELPLDLGGGVSPPRVRTAWV